MPGAPPSEPFPPPPSAGGSQETAGLPFVFLLKSVIPLFAGLMLLQGAAQAMRAVAALGASGR